MAKKKQTSKMQTRLIKEIGTRAYLRRYVSSLTACPGPGKYTYHNAMTLLGDTDKLNDFDFHGHAHQRQDADFPHLCDQCKVDMRPLENSVQVFYQRLYDTKSGSPEPGDMYLSPHDHWDEEITASAGHPLPKPTSCIWNWINCNGLHLHVITPDGHNWDVDGRASNCTLKQDFEHRCWVRTGVPPMITVGKSGGKTCSAGGGSIQTGSWHGFLRNGVLEA